MSENKAKYMSRFEETTIDDVPAGGGKKCFPRECTAELPQKGGEGPKLDKKEFVKLKSLINFGVRQTGLNLL